MTTVQGFDDALIACAGWLCPTCVPLSVSARFDDEGWAIAITHTHGCSSAAAWLIDLDDTRRALLNRDMEPPSSPESPTAQGDHPA